MPEYLAPGVYVEEVSFRAKSIEGVPTSTTGFVGLAKTGPVRYEVDATTHGPKYSEPRLITSFTEFERVYGGLGTISVGQDAAGAVDRMTYLAHAARAYFLNGGRRLYVSRVFAPRAADNGVASVTVPLAGGGAATWRARWPGAAGNVFVRTAVTRSKNIGYADDRFAGSLQARGAKVGALVEILDPAGTIPKDNEPVDPNNLYVISIDANGKQVFNRGGAAATPNADRIVQLIQLLVQVIDPDNERNDVYTELAVSPDQKRDIVRILDKDDPSDENAAVWLDFDYAGVGADPGPRLVAALRGTGSSTSPDAGRVRLSGGNDGDVPAPYGDFPTFAGMEADPDNADKKATGLAALGEIDDIAIVAIPDAAALEDGDRFTLNSELIRHCESLRYRIAVIDGPEGASMSQIRSYRSRFDTEYAAMYHPWIEIVDPRERPAQGAPPRRLAIPPSGFVTGIYARSDITRGVFKAPANEVVFGLTQFEININKARQDVLNPEGINALRFFPGRGNRVWGARTMSSDPEWKYVNVRRLFIYLEHSIDKSTQWAVFEPNNERLWANIRQTIEDFLLVQWKNGALMGTKPEEAYFVRCDRTTMSQNEIDNGQLICLIGIAPTKPAEYVIFRIGQWTADAKSN